jgi:hypothetical protein
VNEAGGGDHQELAQMAVAGFGDPAAALLAAGRVLLWRDARRRIAARF